MPKEERHHDWEDFGAPTSPMVPIISPKKTTSKFTSRSPEKLSHRRREEKSDDKKRRQKEMPEATKEKKKALKEKRKSRNSNSKSPRRTSKERRNNTKTAETLMSPVSHGKTTLKLIDADKAVIRSPARTTSHHSERERRTISRTSPVGKSSNSRKIKLKGEKMCEDLPFSSSSPPTSALQYQQLNASEHQPSSIGADVALEETAGFRVTQTSGNISLWEMRQKFKRDFPSEPMPSDVVLRQVYKSDKLALYDLRERYEKEKPETPMLSNDDLQQLYQKPKEAKVRIEQVQSLERPPPLVVLHRGESVMTFESEVTWEGYGISVKKMEPSTTKGNAIDQEDGEMEEEDLQLEPKEWQEDLHASLKLMAASADNIPTRKKHPDDRRDWATNHGSSKNGTNVPINAAWDKRFSDSTAVGEKAIGTAQDKSFHGSSYREKSKSGIDLLDIPTDHFPSTKEDVAFEMSFHVESPASDPSTRETPTRSSIDLLATESDHRPRQEFAKSSIDLLATESNHPPAETVGRSSIELLEDPSDHLERSCDKTSAKETPSASSFQEAAIELMEIASKHARREEAPIKDNVKKRGEKSQRRSRRSIDPEYEIEKTFTRASEKAQRKSRRAVSLDTFDIDESDLTNEMIGLGLIEEEAPSSPRGVGRSKSEPLGNMRSPRSSDIITRRSDRTGDEEGLQDMLILNPSKFDASPSPRNSTSRGRIRIREKSAKKRKEEMEKKSLSDRRKIKFVPGANTRRSENTVAAVAPSNITKFPTSKRPTKAASNNMAMTGTWMSDVPSMLLQRPEVVVGRSETVSPLTAASKKGVPAISRRRFAIPNP